MLEKMPCPLNRMVQQSPLVVCLGLPNLAKDDQIRWRWTADGNYSAKSAYLAQFMGSDSNIMANSIWKAHAEGKLNVFYVAASTGKGSYG